MRRIVVDGVEYHWRGTSDIYGSSEPSLTIVESSVYGQGAARTIRAAFPYRLPHDQPGWWNELHVTTVMPKLVERTIRIASRRTGNTTLTVAEVLEVLDLDRPRPQDRLRDFELALGTRPFGRLIAAVLAIGCHGDRGELIDDWFACHSDELLLARSTFQALGATVPSWNLTEGAQLRSALAFLVEACGRVGIEMPLDTSALDAHLLVTSRAPAPWGIPADHDWWTSE